MFKILCVSLILIKTTVADEFSLVSTTPLPSDLLKLTQTISKLENRIEYTETLRKNNDHLNALQLQITQVQSTVNSINARIATMEAKLEKKLDISSDDPKKLPTDCKDVQKRGTNVSGMYLIQPKYSSESFLVLCNMETMEGGWAYFLNRFDGSQNFYLNWTDYKKGFGNPAGEFWLGLESLHQLTGSEANELLVELEDFEGNSVYALYNAFVLGSEEEGYPIKVLGTYSGNAGDSLRSHAGMKFTTQDKDQDTRDHNNCALQEKGSWWYHSCTQSNLAARYLGRNVNAGDKWQIMYWDGFKGPSYSLKEARMMVRPRSLYSSSVLNKFKKNN